MARDPDEDALSWGDERDNTHVESAEPASIREDAPPVSAPAAAEPGTVDGDTGAVADPESTLVADPRDAEIDDLQVALAEAELHVAEEAEARQIGSVALVTLGVIGGIYLLYTLGWLGAVLRDTAPFGDDQLFQRVMYQIGQLLAVAAAPLWFTTTIILSRPAVIRRGLPWLAAGLVLLAPFPFLWAV